MADWFEEGLRFECTRCGRCCGGGPGAVWVTPVEAVAIADYLGITLEEFGRRYLRRFASGSLSLTEKPNYDCIFLENGRCAVYPVRPAQCRLFPFWKEHMVSRSAWEEGTGFCPGVGRGRLYTADEIRKILEEQA